MPQMFPLLWLTLYITTIILFLLMMTLIFYTSKPNISLKIPSNLKFNPNWKW